MGNLKETGFNSPAQSFNYFIKQPWFKNFAYKFINRTLENVLESPIVNMVQKNIPDDSLGNKLWTAPILYKCMDAKNKTVIVIIRSNVEKFSYSQQILADGALGVRFLESEKEWLSNNNFAPIHIIQLCVEPLYFGDKAIYLSQKGNSFCNFDKQFSVHPVRYDFELIKEVELMLRLEILKNINQNPIKEILFEEIVEKINTFDYHTLSYLIQMIANNKRECLLQDREVIIEMAEHSMDIELINSEISITQNSTSDKNFDNDII